MPLEKVSEVDTGSSSSNSSSSNLLCVLWQELELACGRHFGASEAATVSHDAGGATPGLAAASQSASGLSRFTLSTHSPSTESPFHSHASKLSSPSVMGVSGVSRINSPSLSRVNAQRSTIQYNMKYMHINKYK